MFYRQQSPIDFYNDLVIDNLAGLNTYVQGVGNVNDQWENIVIPEIHDDYGSQFNFNNRISHNTKHTRNFLLKGLKPGTNYEARVQARNGHGWNKLSKIFHFSTRNEGTLNKLMA